MVDDSVTVAVLKEIRDELKSTRTELRTGLADVRAELATTREELSARISLVETAVLDVAEQQRFVVRWLRANRERERGTESALLKLTRRVDAIEHRLDEE